jgi:hypothetical protein
MHNFRAAITVVLTLVLLSNATAVHAGAWLIKKGKVWGQYNIKWASATKMFNAKGEKKSISGYMDGRKWQFSMLPKLEYGVTDWLNALLYMDYKEVWFKEYNRPASMGPFSHKNHGIDSIQTGAKIRIIKDPIMFTLQPKVFIYPGYGNYQQNDPSYSNYPPIGYGDDAFELRVLTGKELWFPVSRRLDLHCYWKLESGYRWRTRHVANDIPFYACFGIWPKEWLLLNTEIDSYKCAPGTGSIKESSAIWRSGIIWQVFGNSTLRQGAQMFNIEFQYGMTVWGKNTTAYNEYILSIHSHF